MANAQPSLDFRTGEPAFNRARLRWTDGMMGEPQECGYCQARLPDPNATTAITLWEAGRHATLCGRCADRWRESVFP